MTRNFTHFLTFICFNKQDSIRYLRGELLQISLYNLVIGFSSFVLADKSQNKKHKKEIFSSVIQFMLLFMLVRGPQYITTKINGYFYSIAIILLVSFGNLDSSESL